MNQGHNCSNKENRGRSPSQFASLSDEDRLKKLQSLVSSSFAAHGQGCQNMEIELMSPQEFRKTFSSDPIFKTKVELMFSEEQKLLKTYGQLIAKERMKKMSKEDKQFEEFQKEGTLKQRTALNMFNYVELCQKLKTYLGGQDK